MQRRALLTTVGAALSTAAVGGCLATDGRFGLGDDEPVPEPAGPTRGESDADVKTEVVEDDPNVEYLEDRDAVRYVAYWSSGGGDTPVKTDEHGRRAIYETVPFDRWAEKELLHAAAKAAAAHVNEVLDTDEVGYGVGTGGGDQEGSIAYVVVSTVLNRQGEVAVGSDGERLTTDVEFDDLVAATPATVSVVYRFEENEVEQEVPVYATHDVIQHS